MKTLVKACMNIESLVKPCKIGKTCSKARKFGKPDKTCLFEKLVKTCKQGKPVSFLVGQHFKAYYHENMFTHENKQKQRSQEIVCLMQPSFLFSDEPCGCP